jgi:hypothetical protein
MRFSLGLYFGCGCFRFYNNKFGSTVVTEIVFIREGLVAAAQRAFFHLVLSSSPIISIRKDISSWVD